MSRIMGRSVMLVIIIAILGSLFLVQTNSRSSILIKETFYVAGAALVMLAASVSMMLTGRIAGNRIGRFALITLVLLLGWMIFRHITGIGSVNGGRYIFSTVALASIAFLITSSYSGKERDLTLLVMVLSASVISVYAILQSFGVIIFSWDAGLTQMSRSSSTMGNANLLGSFAMAMLPVGGGFLLSRHGLSRLRIPAAIIFALLCTGAVIASKTRGSLIGLASIALLIPFIPSMRRNLRRMLPLVLVLVVLLAGSVLILGNRMEELVHTGTGTLQVRNLIWSGALKAVLESPVTGYGPGAFQIVFPGFRDPRYFILGVSHNTLHSHCEYLEIMIDTGIVGLLLWGMLVFWIFRKVYTFRRNVYPSGPEEGDEGKARRWMALGITGGIVALLAEATVSVALRWPPSALLMALLTGLLLACIDPEYISLKGMRRIGTSLGMLIIAVLLGLVAVPYYLRAMESGRQLFIGKDVYLTNIQQGLDNSLELAQEWVHSGDNETMGRALYYYDASSQAADSSIAWCELCVETNPDELGGWYALGSAYISKSRFFQQMSPQLGSLLRAAGREVENPIESERNLRLGLAAYDSLRSRAPDYAELNNNYSLVWINLGYPDSSLSYIRRAWDLHFHNRKAYIEKISILSPLVESIDEVYLKFQHSIVSLAKMEDNYGFLDIDQGIYREILFYYGLVFSQYPEVSDSLRNELTEMFDELPDDIAESARRDLEFQAEHLDDGDRLLGMLQQGDTTGVLEELDGIDPSRLAKLPMQYTLYGYLHALQGDISGLRVLTEILSYYMFIDPLDMKNILDFDMGAALDVLISRLLETGLTGVEERELFFRSEYYLLNLDRKIFTVMVFAQSNPGISENTAAVQDSLMEFWSQVGGPLYCYMEMRDDYSQIPIMKDSSLVWQQYQGLRDLQAADSTRADLIMQEIEWLYIYFCSSYKQIPHYSNVQRDIIVRMLAENRNRLAALIGENETQYLIGSSLSRIEELGVIEVWGEFTNYSETLKSDLIMGRIPLPDLP